VKTLRKHRIIWVCILLGCSVLAGSLVIIALRSNLNFFFTPSQVVQGEAPKGTRIRVGGMIEKGSVIRGENLQVEFIVTDFNHKIKIQYSGILPDLFREGQGIVAMGHLISQNEFKATEVLAKHDENYMPPELGKL